MGRGRRRVLPSGLALAVALSSLATGLLPLAGAALLDERSAVGADAALVAADPWERCAWLQVGSQHAGRTLVHVQNTGPSATQVGVVWVSESGAARLAIDDSISLGSWASPVIEFRAPALGSGVRLLSSVTHVDASAEIDPEDGAAPESRRAHLCRSP